MLTSQRMDSEDMEWLEHATQHMQLVILNALKSSAYLSFNEVITVQKASQCVKESVCIMNIQLTRLDMNQFSLSAVDIADLPVATRQQVPSFQDLNLRGFIAGFACKYLEKRACMNE